MLLACLGTAPTEAALTESAYVIDHWGPNEGLPQSTVNSLAQTEDGYIWMATFNGLARFDGLTFKVFNESNSDLNSHRLTALKASGEKLYIGEFGSRLALREGNTIAPVGDQRQDSGNLVERIELTLSGAPITLLSRSGIRNPFDSGTRDRISWRQAAGVAADTAGNIWTHDTHKLYRDRGRGAKEIALPEVSANISALAVTHNGIDILLIAGDTLYRRKASSWEVIYTSAELRAHRINQMLEDAGGNIWLATHGSGLYRIDRTGSTLHWNSGNGLYSNIALCVMEDREGNIWLGTLTGGVHRLKRDVMRNEVPPALVIQEIRIDNKIVAPLDNLFVVPAGNHRLSIHYVGLSFTAPEKTRYQFKLQGYDNDLQDAGTSRRAEYTQVPPGDYVFILQAANIGAVRSATPLQINIRVLAHFYQTSWFRILLLITFFSFLVIAARLLSKEKN